MGTAKVTKIPDREPSQLKCCFSTQTFPYCALSQTSPPPVPPSLSSSLSLSLSPLYMDLFLGPLHVFYLSAHHIALNINFRVCSVIFQTHACLLASVCLSVCLHRQILPSSSIVPCHVRGHVACGSLNCHEQQNWIFFAE